MTKHIFVSFFSSIILPFIAHADHLVGDRDTDHINLRESDVVLIRLLSKDKHNHIYSLILDNTKGKKTRLKHVLGQSQTSNLPFRKPAPTIRMLECNENAAYGIARSWKCADVSCCSSARNWKNND